MDYINRNEKQITEEKKSPCQVNVSMALQKAIGNQAVMQLYTYTEHGKYFLSDDRSILMPKTSDKHYFYTSSSKVDAANQALSQNSKITLVPMEGQPGVKRANTESGTSDKIAVTASYLKKQKSLMNPVEERLTGDNLVATSDCGGFSNLVLGDEQPRPVFIYQGSPCLANERGPFSEPEIYRNGAIILANHVLSKKIEAYRNESPTFAQIYPSVPGDRDTLMRILYESPTLAAEVGVNAAAKPEVGDAMVTLTGGPNRKKLNSREDKPTWAFHWGGVVIKSDDGNDQIMIENFADLRGCQPGEPPKENNKWEFNMYGTEKDQSFHEQHNATNMHGETPTTMIVRADPKAPQRGE